MSCFVNLTSHIIVNPNTLKNYPTPVIISLPLRVTNLQTPQEIITSKKTA
jgi:hypothetical protein